MTVLEWDAVGDRRYEIGIDRGVLYPFEGDAVVWNGLTEITEVKSREIKSYYIDGVKFLDHHVPGSYAGTLKAFTYPDVLDHILGTHEFVPGVDIHDQRAGMFHLSYRTLVGADGDYKLHLLYNLMASPGDATFNTLSDSPTPTLFEWALSGVPATMWGIRPTSHLSFDSRRADPAVMQLIEDQLYGTLLTDPVFPDLVELLTSIEALVAP